MIIGANHASPLSLARTQLTLDSLLSLLNSRSTGGTAREQQEQRRLVSNERSSHDSERRVVPTPWIQAEGGTELRRRAIL